MNFVAPFLGNPHPPGTFTGCLVSQMTSDFAGGHLTPWLN